MSKAGKLGLTIGLIASCSRAIGGVTFEPIILEAGSGYSVSPGGKSLATGTFTPQFTVVRGAVIARIDGSHPGISIAGANLDVLKQLNPPSATLLSYTRATTPFNFTFGGSDGTVQVDAAGFHGVNLLAISNGFAQSPIVPVANFLISGTPANQFTNAAHWTISTSNLGAAWTENGIDTLVASGDDPRLSSGPPAFFRTTVPPIGGATAKLNASILIPPINPVNTIQVVNNTPTFTPLATGTDELDLGLSGFINQPLQIALTMDDGPGVEPLQIYNPTGFTLTTSIPPEIQSLPGGPFEQLLTVDPTLLRGLNLSFDQSGETFLKAVVVPEPVAAIGIGALTFGIRRARRAIVRR